MRFYKVTLLILLVLITGELFAQSGTVMGTGAANLLTYQKGGYGAEKVFGLPVLDTAACDTMFRGVIPYRLEGRITVQPNTGGLIFCRTSTRWVCLNCINIDSLNIVKARLSVVENEVDSKQDSLGFIPSRVYNIHDFGAIGTDTLDDVPAIQDAVNTALGFSHVAFDSTLGIDTIRQITRNAVGGDVYFPNGIYRWKRRLINKVVHFMLDGDTIIRPVNTQVYIPYFADFDTSKLNPATIRFVGETAPPPSLETPTRDVNRKRWTSGMQNISTVKHDGSIYPSMLSSVVGDTVFSVLYPNIVYIITKNFWVTVDYDSANGGTQLCGIDLQYALDSWVEDSKADAFTSSYNTIRPTHEVYGIRLNSSNYGTVNGLVRSMATNFTYGGVVGSQASVDNFNSFMCWMGLNQLSAVHTAFYGNKGIMAQWCAWSIGTDGVYDPFSSDPSIIYGYLSEERYCPAGRWYSYQGEVKDSLNKMRGRLKIETRDLGCDLGLNTFILQGATKLYIEICDTNKITINGNVFVQDYSGNIGIGVNRPQARLDVRGSSSIVGIFKYLGGSNTPMEVRIIGSSRGNANITLMEVDTIRWYVSNIGTNSHFAITESATNAERFTILSNQAQFNCHLTTTGTDNYSTNMVGSYTVRTKPDKNYVDSLHNTPITISSTVTAPVSVTTSSSSNNTVTFTSSNSLSQMGLYVINDRTTTFNSYGGLLIGGSANPNTLLGFSRRDRMFVFSDGANTNGIVIGTGTNDSASFVTNNVARMIINGSGNIGIGSTAMTARLHLPAGTTTAGSAALKMTSGSRLTTPEDGVFGTYDGTHYYATVSSTEYILAKLLKNTATLDFVNTAAQNSTDLTVTVTGAVVGDLVILGTAFASVSANSNFTAFVSATNIVTVRFNNYSASSIDPPSGSFTVAIAR